MKGQFIVLEGIDGCGKSTQIRHLSNWLPKSGLMPKGARLIITREPGGTPLGKALRQLLLTYENPISPAPLTELLLYAADRAQHLNELVLPAIERGDWVLSDRFNGSTIAYQGYARDIDMDLINKLDYIATQGLKSDLNILLEISVKESIERRSSKNNDRIESEGPIFLEKVSKGFHLLSEQQNWIKVSANKSKESVSKDLEESIKNFYFTLNKTTYEH